MKDSASPNLKSVTKVAAVAVLAFIALAIAGNFVTAITGLVARYSFAVMMIFGLAIAWILRENLHLAAYSKELLAKGAINPMSAVTLVVLVGGALGAIMFGGSYLWMLHDYKNSSPTFPAKPKIVVETVNQPQPPPGRPRPPKPEAEIPKQPLVKLPSTTEQQPEAKKALAEQILKDDQDLAAAEEAAEHHRRTSLARKLEEIKTAYKEYCDKIAKEFNLPSWSPKNQITKMVAQNAGDTEPLKRANAEFPGTAWWAVRVLVAYETESARPMHMSYIFIGRTLTGEEVVALFNSDKQWNILTRSGSSSTDNKKLITETINAELRVLRQKIAVDIRRLP